MLLDSGMLVITILKMQTWQTNGVDIVSRQSTYSDVMIRYTLRLIEILYR